MPEPTTRHCLQATLDRLADHIDDGRMEEYEAAERRGRIMRLRLPMSLERALLVGRDEHGNDLRRSTDSYRRLTAAAESKRLIVLQGPPGTGKTFAAALHLADVERARWISAPELCRLAPWDPAVDGYRYTPHLGLDDVGVEQSQRAKIEEMLYERHAEGKTTICTTNLTPEQFQEAYDRRVISRMREVGAWCRCREIVRPHERGTVDEH